MATKRKKAKPIKAAPVKRNNRKPAIQAKDPVSDKHRLFAMHYALTENAEQSAKDAGFTASTARKKAYRWVGKSRQESYYPDLFDLVEHIRTTQIQPKLQQKFNITSDRVLNELARIGFSDIRKFYNDDNSLKAVKDLDDDCAAVVSSIEVDEIWEYDPVEERRKQTGETKKLKMNDKKGSLELLGRHLGLWKDNANDQPPTAVTLIVQTSGEAPKVSDGH